VPVAITIEAAAHVWEVLACAAPPLGINHVAKAGTKYVHGVAIQPTTTVFTASELPGTSSREKSMAQSREMLVPLASGRCGCHPGGSLRRPRVWCAPSQGADPLRVMPPHTRVHCSPSVRRRTCSAGWVRPTLGSLVETRSRQL